jgi:carboxymethylenebutenolidase
MDDKTTNRVIIRRWPLLVIRPFILAGRSIVTEQPVEIRTPDGTSDGILFTPEEGRRLPGVIFYTDIGGIRPSQTQMAARLAAEGYTVLLPNIFYRSGKLPVFDFTPKFGDERTTKRMAELRVPLTPEAVERDGAAYLDFLAGQPSVSSGPMGVLGLCFSGAMALRTAAARPDRIAAAASFHGGGLYTDDPSSPHLTLPRIKARLYFGHAVEDKSMPREAIDKLNQALKDWGGPYESEVYEGAHHSWTVPDSPVYNQPQAERAFGKLKQLFAETLK